MKSPAAQFLQMEVCHFKMIYNNMNVIGIASEAAWNHLSALWESFWGLFYSSKCCIIKLFNVKAQFSKTIEKKVQQVSASPYDWRVMYKEEVFLL